MRKLFPDLAILAALILLAAFFRAYRLDELPPGLHYDEAFKAVTAERLLAGGERPIFFRENMTEEPMAIYAAALSFAIFGASPWALRIVSALVGILGVAALYAFARAVFASRLIAALAALVLAILYWHVNFSRLGMEPIFAPTMMTLCVLFLWRGWNKSNVHSLAPLVTRHASLDFVLAGIFLAATQYTYKAALVFPFFIFTFLFSEIFARKNDWKELTRPLALFALAALLGFAPLGLYFAQHPAEFLERPTSVVLNAAGVATILDNTLKVGGMFFLRGDANPRSNLPDRPALDPFLAILFLIGMLACARSWRDARARLILLWFGVQLLPSILSDFAPHFGRSIGATPALALIVAWGIASLKRKAESTKPHAPYLLFTVYCLLATGFAFSAFSTYRDYFQVWGARTGNFDSFDVGVLELAQKLRVQSNAEQIYLSPLAREHYTIQFGLNGRAAESFDGRRALVIAPNATYGVITRDDPRTLARLTQIFPNGAITARVFDFAAQPYAAIFRAAGAPTIAPQKNLDARVGDVAQVIGYDLMRDGNALALTIYWRARAESREDFTVFAHLVDSRAQVIAQDDAPPGHQSYPTSRWRADEIVMDDYRFVLPESLARGEYRVEIGMYILETGARLIVTDANGARMENDRVLLERISLP